MSTLSKNTPPKLPVTEPKKATATTQQSFLFDKDNYMWMIGGLVLIFLGLFLMSGGKSANPNEFNYAEIYSFRRITLAPVLMMIGFGVEVYAIMKKPKETNATNQQ
jgi:hypothetical protein